MTTLIAVLAASFITWYVTHRNYRGHIQDLRDWLAFERKMRKYEEDRAETLSDALFGRTRTRQRNDTGAQN
jgi:hypothetical protein